MPYIQKQSRIKYDDLINQTVNKLSKNAVETFEEGELNYVISSIVWKLFDQNRRYKTGNGLVGVLECVKQEFYRRQLSVYEDEKIKSEGDI